LQTPVAFFSDHRLGGESANEGIDNEKEHGDCFWVLHVLAPGLGKLKVAVKFLLLQGVQMRKVRMNSTRGKVFLPNSLRRKF
jgi:hypothetical protein